MMSTAAGVAAETRARRTRTRTAGTTGEQADSGAREPLGVRLFQWLVFQVLDRIKLFLGIILYSDMYYY